MIIEYNNARLMSWDSEIRSLKPRAIWLMRSSRINLWLWINDHNKSLHDDQVNYLIVRGQLAVTDLAAGILVWKVIA